MYQNAFQSFGHRPCDLSPDIATTAFIACALEGPQLFVFVARRIIQRTPFRTISIVGRK